MQLHASKFQQGDKKNHQTNQHFDEFSQDEYVNLNGSHVCLVPYQTLSTGWEEKVNIKTKVPKIWKEKNKTKENQGKKTR